MAETMSYNSRMADPESPTEDLVRGFQQNEDPDDCFRVLFRRHFGQVLWFFQRKGIPAEDARDMTQDVFVSVYKALPGLQEPSQFAGWLFVIARNAFNSHLEKQHTQKRSWAITGDYRRARSSLEPDALADRRAPSAADMVLNREKLAKLRGALCQLPSQMRRCLHLRIAEEHSYDEIAVIMGLSIGTVKSHIHRAREKLREDLRPYFGDVPV